MNKLEILKWNFLCELKELSGLKEQKIKKEKTPGEFINIELQQNFEIYLTDDKDFPLDFKCDYMDYLQRIGAVVIVDEYFGAGITKSGDKVNIVGGAPLRIFGYKPIKMTVKINKDTFNKEFEKHKELVEAAEDDQIKCSYNNFEECLLVIDNISIKFTGTNGLILYYLYTTKKLNNLQDFKTYNKFIEDKKYSDKYYVDSIKFRQSVKDINDRIKKETENHIVSLIKKINNDNKRNEYKWGLEKNKN